MKRFLLRLILFAIPVYIYFSLVVLIDPYNYFNCTSCLVAEDIKLKISYKIDYPLFKLIRFKHDPKNYILLGDSRVNALDVNYIWDCSGKEFANMAYGGGSLREVIDTFWAIQDQVNLKEVYIGINFDLFSDNIILNRTSEAIKSKANPINYAINKHTFQSIIEILKCEITGNVPNLGDPTLDKEQFWQYQLQSAANNAYRTYKYPKSYIKELKQISDYCKMHKIELIFFVPPTHTDLQSKTEEFSLLYEKALFMEKLKGLSAIVYDFDFENNLTIDPINFNDPYHANQGSLEVISNIMFCNQVDYQGYVRIYPKQNRLSK